MIESTLPMPRVILYEGPRAEPLEGELRNRLLQTLLERGYAVRRIRGAEVALDRSAPAKQPLIIGNFGGQVPESDDLNLPVRLRDIITALAVEDVLAACGIDLPRAACPAGKSRQTLEAVVSGDRLFALHELHAMSELLLVRRLWCFAGRQDPGAARKQLQDRLPGLLPGLPGSCHHVPQVQSAVRSTATRSTRKTSAVRR